MTNGAKQYKFIHVGPYETAVVCPVCKQVLTQHDLEGFGRCPFCDTPFRLNRELADFMYEPLVNSWLRRNADDISR